MLIVVSSSPAAIGLTARPTRTPYIDDIVADRQASHGKLVFGGNALRKSVDLASEFDLIAGFKVGEGDQNVVARVELEDGSVHEWILMSIAALAVSAGPAIASGHCKAFVRGSIRLLLNVVASRQNRLRIAAEHASRAFWLCCRAGKPSRPRPFACTMRQPGTRASRSRSSGDLARRLRKRRRETERSAPVSNAASRPR